MFSKIIFCKSKVFIHPSSVVTENISGFIIITVDPNQSHQDALLYWFPENSLNSKQLDWLNDADLKYGKPSVSSTASSLTSNAQPMDDSILMDTKGTYLSFTIKLSSLYSIEFRPPSSSGWWFGSIILHPRNDGLVTLPVLFFHDDVCPSTKQKQKALQKNFDPFNAGDLYWGGIDLQLVMSQMVDLQRTKVDPNFWLINASLEALRNFSSKDLKDVRTNNSEGYSASGKPKDKKSSKGFWDKWESTKWSIMSGIATATAKSEEYMTKLVNNHPAVKYIEQNNDNPYVRNLLKNPKVQEIQNDFDSARIYLAKWSLGVKEEANKYKLDNQLNESYRKMLTNDLGFDVDTDSSFTEEELNRVTQRNFPLTQQKWESFFDSQGRLAVTTGEVKDFIFHGGVDTMELRQEVWLFLLEIYPWDSSKDERDQIDETLKEVYNTHKFQWMTQTFEDDKEEEYWKDQLFRIDKDVKRNDRHVGIFKYNTTDGKPENTQPSKPRQAFDQSEVPDIEQTEDNDNQARNNFDDNDNEDVESIDGHWAIRNPHLIILGDILKTYNIFNTNLGYVQGMTDLLSPIYYIVRDEVKAFWCFVHFMDRMERNFLRDQSGIRDQMLTMTELCQLMLPQLSDHLNKCDSSNLFFCFRMLLVWFKREFNFEDICGIWEIFWTDYYSSQFQLFFMLAILQKNSEPIINNLNQFDQVIKYFNDLHNTMDWRDLMIRAELLFIRFEKLMSLMERKEELARSETDPSSGVNNKEASSPQLPIHSKHLQLLLSKKIIVRKEETRTLDSIR
ncbi:similar to Saccharomyces cerevisiae YDL234C GYP7 GTPase-activating protein for yeast Rab family members including: Ypt7p (most effective), Ypt1p, Ypt31p, and Ypt32p (in vitro) [Maudiozyma saulgeensis]|uniref:Similar to Saccharomyces cerevisiae YDL234C GYP7 GTPase-activating protein for yeast Rab family members including: Ypt7p (Most effective), Ypt1p, Ypt31p, and Ypt32p (In vitro) n=1 Tax=Maudiozyma saulgeensis TaxID=1789683 RepID=A0A1X7R6Q0_9SACH|nr:similar to Saccharomyces cerevisiae YDL234C GYP7 GTPase-activating protein for yeast Rab family members including: Ypt7p (most effective), Ypt1p, Ypt31p, and Ypt32p (in vitro) [Kazachstania saulgeensis]